MVYGVKKVNGKVIVNQYDSKKDLQVGETLRTPENLQDYIEDLSKEV